MIKNNFYVSDITYIEKNKKNLAIIKFGNKELNIYPSYVVSEEVAAKINIGDIFEVEYDSLKTITNVKNGKELVNYRFNNISKVKRTEISKSKKIEL